jgi:hypothetical protein
MNDILKGLDGKKTWLGLLVMALITFGMDVGWWTELAADKFMSLAEFWTIGAAAHKAQKVLTKKG